MAGRWDFVAACLSITQVRCKQVLYLSEDCAHPRLASSIRVPNSFGHMSGWADDGKTYYIGQQFRGVGGILPIIDVTNPYNAEWLLNWTFTGDGRPHDVNTNNDGSRLCAGQPAILTWLAERVSVEHIVLGSDYSFPPADLDPVGTARKAGFSNAEFKSIAEDNPRVLFPRLPAA